MLEGPRARLRVFAAGVLWVVAALALSWSRVPFDDEWYSIELARSDAAHFWRALSADVHPPWSAWLDRSVLQLVPSLRVLQLIRVALSASALLLTLPWLAQRTRRGQAWLWLAAFHPIVIMYAGALRWYPWLMLAQALRARSLWGFDRASRRVMGFVGGALLGAAAGYIDGLFLVQDAGFWLARERERHRASHADSLRVATRIATVAVSIALSVTLHALSPLGFAHMLGRGTLGYSISAPFTWAVLGAAGEAAPAWPWPCLLPLVLLTSTALIRGLWLGLSDPMSRPFVIYLSSTVAIWLATTQLGIWHPRYSLWLFYVLTASSCAWLVRTALGRVWLASACCAWGFALAHTIAQQGFYKADLNRLSSNDCAALHGLAPHVLVVAPYPRLAELVQKECGIPNPVLSLPSIRVTPDVREQLQALDTALTQLPREIVTLRVQALSSLTESEARVHAALATRCRFLLQRDFGAIAHRELKRALGFAPPISRFSLERWYCPAREAR
jgi:hypothetical protein